MKEPKVPFHIQLRRARIAKGYSRAALAKACGMNAETFRTIEVGKRKTRIPPDRLMVLEDILGVVFDFGEGDAVETVVFGPDENNKMRLQALDLVMTLDPKHLRFILSTLKEI